MRIRHFIVRLAAIANALGAVYYIARGFGLSNDKWLIGGYVMLMVSVGLCGLDFLCEVATKIDRREDARDGV